MKFPNGTNYVEIFIGNTNGHNHPFQIGLSDRVFYDILKRMHQKNYKFFQRVFKEYIYNDMTCQCHTNDEVKVFRLIPLEVVTDPPAYINVYYQRTKLTLLNFPSTRSIHHVQYVKQLIFRVNNRIYINFKVSVDDQKQQKTYQIFVNYNHEENLEMSPVLQTIQELLQFMTPLEPIC
jgi:hypothetical protein